MLGDRTSLKAMISTCTAIDEEYLVESLYCQTCTVAQKMSWAAQRETTREEDVAYCLLGLFSVNMPLLYGEGPRAFMRLQEEIMKISDDHSIFALTSHEIQGVAEPFSDITFENLDDPNIEAALRSFLLPTYRSRSLDWIGHGLLATSPKAFSNVGKVSLRMPQSGRATSYQMTNRGLRISLSLTRLRPFGTRNREIYAADLQCAVEFEQHRYLPLGIYLQPIGHMPSEMNRNEYERVRCNKLIWGVPGAKKLTEIFVQQRRV